MAKLTTKQLNATGEQILNVIRANSSLDYQNRVPQATQDNIKEVGNAITNYQPTMNEFLNALVNRIGLVMIQSRMYENPLRRFKKGMLEFGKDVEEVFVSIAKAQAYDPKIAEDEVFKRVIPDVKTIFHRMNRQDFYKVTISNDQLRTAFLSYQGIEDLIAGIVDSLYSGDNFDEFLLMKQLMTDYGANNLFYPIHVDPVTDEASAKKMITSFRANAKKIGFMSNQYNAQNVPTFTNMDDIVIFMTPETEALVDVEALAMAFNIRYSDFIGRVVIVDDFGTGMEDTVALMVDVRWFMVFDTFYNFTEQYNAQGLYWNYFFHHWQILSTSQFANAIQFTTATVTPPTVTGVTVAPATASVAKGATQQFTATVAGTGNVSQNVEWTVTGNAVAGTTISTGGVLKVDSTETATTLTVTATSSFDNTFSGTSAVTVTTPAN